MAGNYQDFLMLTLVDAKTQCRSIWRWMLNVRQKWKLYCGRLKYEIGWLLRRLPSKLSIAKAKFETNVSSLKMWMTIWVRDNCRVSAGRTIRNGFQGAIVNAAKEVIKRPIHWGCIILYRIRDSNGLFISSSGRGEREREVKATQ